MTEILVAYSSRHGSTANMAREIALGVEAIKGATAKLRCLPKVSSTSEQTEPPVPESGPPHATQEDLKNCDGLILGSPAYFGNMSAETKYFLDQSSPLWISGALIDKPAGVFTSSSSMHGGQESVLLSMMIPLLHHGMILSGIPYSEKALHRTVTGGTPYGASHLAGSDGKPLSEDEARACQALGKRVATLANRLK